MLNEKDCNCFIKNLLDFGFKIPDSQVGKRHIKNCFDGFGVFDSLPLYWESKFFSEPKKHLTRKELFSRKHQVENLIMIYEAFKVRNTSKELSEFILNCLCLYCIFIRITSRKVKLFIIKNAELKEMYMSKKQSFTIEEISKLSSGEMVLSTNLESIDINFWSLLNLKGMKGMKA